MKKIFLKIVLIFFAFLIFLKAGPFFLVNEGEQAVVVRFGKITGVYTDAGLKLKVPFIDGVVRFPKKIMAWSGETSRVPTAERQFIVVDVVARWRISDPKKFYESIETVDTAYLKLGEIIDSEVRTVVSANPLHESVRNSNIIMERPSVSEPLSLDDLIIDVEIISNEDQFSSSVEPVVRGRRQLAEEILARSRNMVPEYGIELIDVVTRQISYSSELTPSVYQRMIRERHQIAMLYRSEGEGRKAEWLGRMESEKMTISSAAYGRSQSIRGDADAKAARIYAEAYNGSDRRDFYDFWRAIESYRQTMPNFDKTLTTDMDYFRYLYSMNGRR
jgi:membrane protease subunit HflC